MSSLLEIKNLATGFQTERGLGYRLVVPEGETAGLA